MKRLSLSSLCVAIIFWFLTSRSFADVVRLDEYHKNGKDVFELKNGLIQCSIVLQNGQLISDKIAAQTDWLENYGGDSLSLKTDANFCLDVMWTGWRAPGKTHNADNPVLLDKTNFEYINHKQIQLNNGGRSLRLLFSGKNNPFYVTMTYQLEPDHFFIKRRLSVQDMDSNNHFLRWIWVRRGKLFADGIICKSGGFGNPLVIRLNNGGSFFGLEYPASENHINSLKQGNSWLSCGQEFGEKVDSTRVESEWVVSGLTPNSHVKLWFKRYLDHIRVAPVRPFLLYNTWYDVRSPEYTDNPKHVMNQANLLRIIQDFNNEMMQKRGLHLDAFVLDDGWDVYKSDWELNREQFPNGLKPVREALHQMGTELGIWFGPIGGYSYRNWRIDWMKEHRYEEVGDQLCIAGDHYHKLFQKRVVDFVRKDNVGYYKWDGIQFSCSEPDHGHPVGIYSRRAVMESIIDLCRSVRRANPDIFLNITSGTWLSPWWLKYANTIWMQGRDYGYAGVPSISKRDDAITYRDVVLYQNYGIHDFWFPIENLMTHGIIKGNLQKLGGETEPLDKFTDNAILYFARGVSMWELYVSPDLLTDGEWNALAKSIRWAKDRFDILTNTEMIGGDPGAKEAYGYAHFAGQKGIIAVRNPFIEPQAFQVKLDPSYGLDPNASSLILERVYPTRWISPNIYAAGVNIKIPLDGYETAIYEIYPLKKATEPLLAGTTFEVLDKNDNGYRINVLQAGEQAHLLNPKIVYRVNVQQNTIHPYELTIQPAKLRPLITRSNLKQVTGEDHERMDIEFELNNTATNATLAMLLQPSETMQKKDQPEVAVVLDGEKTTPEIEKQAGHWAWYKIPVRSGTHSAQVKIPFEKNQKKWSGKMSVWLICIQTPKGPNVTFVLREAMESRPMPPRPWADGSLRRTIKIGDISIQR